MVRYGEVVVWWLWAAPGSCTRPPCSRWSPAQQQGENCGQGAASSPHSSLTSHGGGAQYSTVQYSTVQYSTVQYRQVLTLQPDLAHTGAGHSTSTSQTGAPPPVPHSEARRPDNHQLCQSSSLDQKVAAGLGWLGWAGWSCARHQPRSCGHLTTSPPHCTGGAWCRM